MKAKKKGPGAASKAWANGTYRMAGNRCPDCGTTASGCTCSPTERQPLTWWEALQSAFPEPLSDSELRALPFCLLLALVLALAAGCNGKEVAFCEKRCDLYMSSNVLGDTTKLCAEMCAEAKDPAKLF